MNINFSFDFHEFSKMQPFFPFSFLYYMLCKTTTAESCRGNKELFLGYRTLNGEFSLFWSSLMFRKSCHLFELFHSWSFFVPDLFTCGNTVSCYSVLPWTLNNKALQIFYFWPSSPVLIHTTILKELEMEVSIKYEI